MHRPEPATSTSRPTRTWAERVFGRWWRRQSAARQDRYATLGPLASVLLFLAAIVSAFWYLRNEEFEREQEAVRRDTEVAQQQIRLRLIENHEQLTRMARELVARTLDHDSFLVQAAAFTLEHPEISNLIWLNDQRVPIGGYSGTTFPPETGISGVETPASLPVANSGTAPEEAFQRARDERRTVYSAPFADSFGTPVFQAQIPLVDHGEFHGALVAEYSIERLMRYFVSSEIARRHAITVLDSNGRSLASTVVMLPGSKQARPSIVFELPVAPAANGLILRGQGYRTSIGLIGNGLFWMVMLLSALTVWMLLGTWRHMRRRLQMQAALVSETNFRRAMENSMLTGMRARDMEGRISYVTPAFCAMTGFSETDLIGQHPPFPYWPHDRIDENARLLEQELQGKSPTGGIEVKGMRKDGSVFDARMYVSPLIDPKGQQTGWMTSMTNITEAKRIRDQLTASHERFTTVLEGLDTAVSVLSVQQGELLFANRSYRLWFGADSKGHAQLSGGDSSLLAQSAGDDAVDG